MGNKTNRATMLEREVAKMALANANRLSGCSEATRAKISASMKGTKNATGSPGNRTNHPLAHELSKETRLLLSKAAIKGNEMRRGL